MFGVALTRPSLTNDNAIDEWRGRLCAGVRAQGGHFEQLL